MKKEFTIGDYLNVDDSDETVRLFIELPSQEIEHFWSRCGLISNFSSLYLALACSTDKNITNSLSFIINELLENSVKYSVNKNKQIDLCLLQNQTTITLEVSNYISQEQCDRMSETATNLIDTDFINSRYLDMITTNSKVSSKSGIGLLTIINYYNVSLSFKFIETDSVEHIHKLSVQVRISIKEL